MSGKGVSQRELLAIDGGVPVRAAMLPYGHQWITDEDVAAVVEALTSDWLTTGPKVVPLPRIIKL